MIRGVVLIVSAVVLGVVLLQSTEPSDTQLVSATTTTSAAPLDESAGDDAGDEVGEPPADLPPEPRDPGQYTVLVANGSGVAGAAGRGTEHLTAAGFQTATPTDANGQVPASVVLYNEGFEAEAAEVAGVLDPVPPLEPMPEPPPVNDLAGADVVVVVGPDLAGG